ncbi:MAG: 4-oxalocrotonate tautomerase [Dethiobacter sp.]|nr:MAG: 4-oxalocrotonate tautomerase [Dethiobacter sp.]
MPTIFFYGPKLEKEKRRELIRSFTKKASELTGIDEAAFVVYLRNSEPEDVGVGGELLEDRQKRR